MNIKERLKIYAKVYREEPTGREVEGTVELLQEAVEHIEMLENSESIKVCETVKEAERGNECISAEMEEVDRMEHIDYKKRIEELKVAAQPLVDYLYKHGTLHDMILVKMDAVEHHSGNIAVPIQIRD